MLKKNVVLPVILALGFAISGLFFATAGAVRADQGGSDTIDAPNIPVDEEHFPDPVFREFVSGAYDCSPHDGYLNQSEYSVFAYFNVENMGITSMKGIEYFPYAQSVNCDGNNITSLDLSKNHSLKTITCRNNGMTSLIIDSTELTSLDCSANKLQKLDLTSCTSLETLNCYSNELTSLYLSSDALTTLHCYSNQLTTLTVYNCAKINTMFGFSAPGTIGTFKLNAYDGSIMTYDAATEILYYADPEVVFPDPNFRAYVMCADTDHDGILLSMEMEAVQSFNCSNMSIKSMQGLHCFKNLTTLLCDENELEELNVNSLRNLEYLSCGFNKLTKLNLYNNQALVELHCPVNQIEDLDLSRQPNLQRFSCGWNPLGELDVSNNPKLFYFSCCDCDLTTLDLSNNTAMLSLDISQNDLKSFDFSIFSELDSLRCDYCGFTSIDVTSNTKLTRLICPYNPFETLDVTHNPALVFLWCGDSNLSSLDTSKNPELFNLDVAVSKISSLDLSNNTKLYSLFTYGTQIKELDISPCPLLVKLVTEHPLEKYTEIGYNILRSSFTYDGDDYMIWIDEATTLTTVAVNKDPSFAEFIDRLYRYALLREPEADGKAFWMNKVLNEGFTGGRCAYGFLIEAQEFLNRDLTNEQFIDTLYLIFFDRAPDETGKAFWLQKFAEGMTRAEMVNGFIDSTEWCNLCATYGVKSGAPHAKAEIASKNAEKFAYRLYKECLGREPDADGLKFWALRLTNLESSGYEAALGFFTSAEFTQQNVSDDEFIHRLYRTFMDRDEDADGFAFWKSHLGKDMSREDLVKGFAQSQEFTNICNQYGIDKGI